MTAEMQLGHYERINRVKRYIREHLDQDLNREDLAKLAGYSVPHFHRIFTAHGGESISTYVRRVRMEQAARQLLAAEVNVTEVALNSGYETHSAFDKAFKQQFGFNPSEFRALNRIWAGHLINKHIYYNPKEKIMHPLEIITQPDIPVLYARASEMMGSPAFQAANREAFGKLMAYLAQHNLMADMRLCVAIYPDEVEVGKVARFDAGAIFAEGARTSDGRLGEFKPGFALIAKRAGVPIAPAAIVVPPGLATRSLIWAGCSPVCSMRAAVPATVWTASAWARLRGSPAFTPPSARASQSRATNPGPEPDSPVTASRRCSSTA